MTATSDTIDDIHGHAESLENYSAVWGLRGTRGVDGSSGRKVISVGDLIDRSPDAGCAHHAECDLYRL
jgi:hypothetical protein